MMRSFVVCLILSVQLILLGAQSAKEATIIAMSDLHGDLSPALTPTKNNEKVSIGGASILSRYISIVKSKTKNPVFLLDAGDLFQGSLISNYFRGTPVIDFYNYLGVDAVAVGNHEFDYGAISEGGDPLGHIKSLVAKANFPFLAINMYEKAGHKLPPWVRGSYLIEKQGVKVAVIGAASKTTAITTNPVYVDSLSFEDPVSSILSEASYWRERGADYVVVIVHDGIVCQGANSLDEKEISESSGCSGDLASIVTKLNAQKIDLVIGGHTHYALKKWHKGIPVIQNYPHGRDLLMVHLSKQTKTIEGPYPLCQTWTDDHSCIGYKIRSYTGPISKATFMGETITPDTGVDLLLKKSFDEIAPISQRKLNVTLSGSFTRSYSEESAMGNLITDLITRSFEGKADLSVMNNGGIRDNLEAGEVTYGDFYKVLPFDNKPAIIKMKGQTLWNLIQNHLYHGHSGFSWSQLTFKATSSKKLTSVTIGGQPLVKEKLYNVGTNDYLAQGGSFFSSVTLDPSVETTTIFEELPPLRDFLADSFSKLGNKLDPVQFFDPKQRRQYIPRKTSK